MADFSLKQIIDKLNMEFTGESRKLVFWYDEKGEFAEDISEIQIQLAYAKVYRLKPDNQLYTKYFLEKVDTTTNYLIYAPFPKPPVTQNHLEDTLLYSKRFYADRVSLLMADLGIDEKYKPIIRKHEKYFSEKSRIQRFYDLKIENYNEETLLIGIMSGICRIKSCSFEEVLRVFFMEDSLEDHPYVREFEKYELMDAFWKFCEQQFGFTLANPTLEKLAVSMFVTYAAQYISSELPQGWQSLISYKSGNVIAFMDNLMNNVLYRDKYDELSAYVSKVLDADKIFEKIGPENLVDCDSFAVIDEILICWIKDRLLTEDILAKLNGYLIVELCEMRSKMHFGRNYGVAYRMLNCAHSIISQANYETPEGFKKIIEHYQENDCLIDMHYREFYMNYDSLKNHEEFQALRELVENIYTNEYLGKLLPKWNEGLSEQDALSVIPLQREFFNKFVKGNKERTVVIISDGMRYEVGRELYQKLSDNPKSKVSLQTLLSVLPSYTRLGMEALLPHKKLELTDDFKEMIDDKFAIDLVVRQQILQQYVPDSCCFRFDDIKSYTGMALREEFAGKQIIYVYHDAIDNTGENSEDEVFQACRKAVLEIETFITKAAGGANTCRFIITSDHGFIYKRDPVTESDKISQAEEPGKLKKRRYIVSKEPIVCDGICNMGLGYLLGNDDDKVVSYPCSTSVFKSRGSSGFHYVHGGSSPQEMLLPVIDVKMDKGAVPTTTVRIALISLIKKITDLATTLDFIQSDPVNDVIKGTEFKLYFKSDDNEIISNENIYVADKRDEDVQKRLFRMRFTFKNKKYDPGRHYYLVVYDMGNDVEVFRHEVMMDVMDFR